MTTEDAVYAFREAEQARLCANKLCTEARNALLDALGITSRYSTLGRKADTTPFSWRKRDVDTTEVLSPSQRKRLRSLSLELRKK